MGQYIKVASLEDIPLISGKKIQVNGKKIALFRFKNKIYAIQNNCPHQGANLAEGHVKDFNVVCPLHRWSFKLDTGAFIGNESVRIPTYKTKVKNNNVYILLEND